MVVVAVTALTAVTEVEPAHHAVPLWGKVLLAAGFAVAGWIFAGLLGGLTASADEIPQNEPHHPAKHREHGHEQRGLLGGLVPTTLTSLVGTVDQVASTVTTTVNTVTSTVDTLTTTVTTTTTAVVQPIVGGFVPPTTVPKLHPGTGGTAPTRVATAPQPQPAPVARSAPQTTPAPALPVTVAVQQPVKNKQLLSRAVAPRAQQPVSEQLFQGKKNGPAPVPSAPDGQSCTAVAAHDGGGNTKHPLAIFGMRAGAPRVASIGLPRRHTQLDNSRDAALPTTSPD